MSSVNARRIPLEGDWRAFAVIETQWKWQCDNPDCLEEHEAEVQIQFALLKDQGAIMLTLDDRLQELWIGSHSSDRWNGQVAWMIAELVKMAATHIEKSMDIEIHVPEDATNQELHWVAAIDSTLGESLRLLGSKWN